MSYYFGNYGLSSLFGGRSSSSMFYGSLGDYSSIRSGSYKKLLSSYYAKTKGTQSSTANRKPYANRYEWNKTNTYANRALTAVKKEADEYTTTTDAETGVKTTTKGYDMDAITKAVDTFVSDYNSAVKAGKDSSNTNVVRNTEYMTKQTSIYARSLAEVGITVEKDQTLSIDKDKFKSANVESLKRIFNGATSFAAQTANRSSSISQSAARAATTASTYNSIGHYNNFYGNYYGSYNWYF